MPLKISLKPNEKIIINGCVIESSGAPATLLIHNEALLMREKDIMTEDEATTPARRIYYVLQCAYLFAQNRNTYLRELDALIAEFEEAAPSTRQTTAAIRASVAESRFYQSLRQARQLMDREQEILNGLHERGISTAGLFPDPAGRQSAADGGVGADGGRAPHARGKKQGQARTV